MDGAARAERPTLHARGRPPARPGELPERPGEILFYTAADGLAGDFVYSIEASGDGERAVWIASRAGATGFVDGTLRTISAAQGLPEPAQMVALEDRDGAVWFGSESCGLTRLLPAGFVSYGLADGLAEERAAALFDGPDGAPWNDPWTIVGDNVLSATLQGGRGQLSGITGGTARLILPGFAELDADVFVTIEFTDWSAQGFGVYQRQNGGSLTQTDPPGEGYALFLEGFYLQSLGIWTELAGVETLAYASYDPVPGGVQAGVRYRVRYQVQQQGSESALRAKIWLEGDAEPAAWTFEITDATVELQDQPGSFAVDIYNWAGVDSVYVDDVEIWPL
jgi:hypothetical protein